MIRNRLDLVDKLYQESIFPEVLKVSRGERLNSPLVVDFDPTTFCDLQCPECISSGVINKGQFDSDRLVSFAKEMSESQVKAVILIGGGEPLMHKSIGRIIEILSEADISLGMVTNGTLIHRYIDVLAENMSWMRVSVDAATADTFDKFRPSGRKTSVFPTIIDNMREFARRKTGSLGYSFLLMYRLDADGNVTDTNYHEVYEAAKLAKDIGCDYFEVKAMFNDAHYIISAPENLMEVLENQFDKVKDLSDESFEVIYSSTFESLRNRMSMVQLKDYESCPVAELRTTVTPSGVYTCAYHRGNEKAKLGDIQEQSFSELWKNADTKVINPSKDCQFHCARHVSVKEVQKISEGASQIKLVEDYDFFI